MDMFPGWYFLGLFPEGEYADVGSWLLHYNGQVVLLEVPEGLDIKIIERGLKFLGNPLVKFVTASHSHEDHLDIEKWEYLKTCWPNTRFLRPSSVKDVACMNIGGESFYLIKAPKHSRDDIVAVFRGVAMTGDIELNTLESVIKEVPLNIRVKSMTRLRDFPSNYNYHIHTIVSAHVNDIRRDVDWSSLFSY